MWSGDGEVGIKQINKTLRFCSDLHGQWSEASDFMTTNPVYKCKNVLTFSFCKMQGKLKLMDYNDCPVPMWQCSCNAVLLVPRLKDLVLDDVLEPIQHCLLFLVKKRLQLQICHVKSPINGDKGWEGTTSKSWRESGRNQLKTSQSRRKGGGFSHNKCLVFLKSEIIFFSLTCWRRSNDFILNI